MTCGSAAEATVPSNALDADVAVMRSSAWLKLASERSAGFSSVPKRPWMVATDKSADVNNNDSSNRKNHLLLQAEPQIGKTGTYLAILGELRKQIKGDEAEEADDDRDESESSDDNDDDDADGKKMEVGIGHQLCRFPYWKDILTMPPLPEVINRCKYDRFDGGVFRYPSHTPRPIKDPLERRKAKRRKNKKR